MDYAIVIVGAGPAGSTTAYFLSKMGYKVALIDKSKFPRDKPCGGGLTGHVLKRFKHMLSDDVIETFSYGGITYSPSLKNQIKYVSEKPLTTLVLRKKFDYGLVKKAIEQGTDFIDGKKVIDVKVSSDKVTVKLDDKRKISSDILVGADGVWSTVAKKTNLMEKNPLLGMSVVEEYEVKEETMDKYFGKERLGYIHSKFKNLTGYGWVFPKKTHLNIGLGEIGHIHNKKTSNLKELYAEYICLLKKQKLIPENIKINKITGGALPVIPHKKTYANRVLLVGDAGGFINPASGEGIYYAMASGEIAAKTIKRALDSEDTSEKFLSNYQKSWKRDFGKDLKLLYWVSKWQRSSKKSERNLILLKKDKKFRQLVIESMSGNLNLDKYKWKIIRRYIYCSIKFLFSKSEVK